VLQHNHRGYWGASPGKIKNNRHYAVDFNYKGGGLEMVMGSIPTGDAVTGSCILWNPDAPASAEQKGRNLKASKGGRKIMCAKYNDPWQEL